MVNTPCLEKLWYLERLQLHICGVWCNQDWQQRDWQLKVQPPSFPSLQVQLYQRSDHFYWFFRNLCCAAALSCFPGGSTEPSFKCFLFILSKTQKRHIHNKFFVPLLLQAKVKRWVLSSAILSCLSLTLTTIQKLLWSSLRQSVSVLTLKAPLFCFPSYILFPFYCHRLDFFFWNRVYSLAVLNYLLKSRFNEKTQHLDFGLPTSPFPAKHCDCCPLAHEESTPQKSRVFWVSIYWLHKSINNSFGSLPHGPYKCAVHLKNRGE